MPISLHKIHVESYIGLRWGLGKHKSCCTRLRHSDAVNVARTSCSSCGSNNSEEYSDGAHLRKFVQEL